MYPLFLKKKKKTSDAQNVQEFQTPMLRNQRNYKKLSFTLTPAIRNQVAEEFQTLLSERISGFKSYLGQKLFG